MKVILTKQIPKLGSQGDVVEVSPGYGRNFLLANGLAREASQDALQLLSQAKQKKIKSEEKKAIERKKLYNILDKQTILIRATANPEGVLFGGIDRLAIAAAIAKRKKVEINHKHLELPHHLKTLGKHTVVLELGGGEKVTFIVNIEQED